MTIEPDYVTVLPTTDPHKFLVAVMTYHARDDEFIQKKVNREPLPQKAADALADSWAEALQIQKR